MGNDYKNTAITSATGRAEEIIDTKVDEFFDSIRLGDTAKVTRMLDTTPALVNAIKNTPEYDGESPPLRTPLHCAAGHTNLDIAKLLIERGATLGATDEYGSTPLHLASEYGRTEIAELFLDKGANIHAVDQDGNTPLHLAEALKTHSTANLLIEKGANPNLMNKDGEIPKTYSLHFSTVRNKRAMEQAQREADSLRRSSTPIAREVTQASSSNKTIPMKKGMHPGKSTSTTPGKIKAR